MFFGFRSIRLYFIRVFFHDDISLSFNVYSLSLSKFDKNLQTIKYCLYEFVGHSQARAIRKTIFAYDSFSTGYIRPIFPDHTTPDEEQNGRLVCGAAFDYSAIHKQYKGKST